MIRTSVLIVGASSSGLVAAREISRHADVLLVEMKRGIASPPHPADSILDYMAERARESIPREAIIQRVRGFKLVAPNGSEIAVNTPGSSIDKKIFDNILAKEAVDNGARILTRTRLQRIERREDGGFKASIATPGGREIVECDLVIAADGLWSSTARQLGLRTVRYPDQVASAVQADILLGKVRDHWEEDYFRYYFGSVAPGWKATVHPKGDRIASVGAFVRKGRALDYFRKFMQRFPDSQIIDLAAGGDPIATVPDRTCSDGIMVVGGAAGQAGIAYGIFCAKIAASAAIASLDEGDSSRNFLVERYEKVWKKELLKEYELTAFSLRFLERLSDDTLNDLFEIATEREVRAILLGDVSMADLTKDLLSRSPKLARALARAVGDLIMGRA